MSHVVREARLFEAGSYPDRGIEVTESDLDAMVSSFKGPGTVSMRYEHIPGCLDGHMGDLQEVYRRGRELFGKIAFPVSWYSVVKAALGTIRLSVCLDWAARRISEVSITGTPRVLTAQVFSDSIPLVFTDSEEERRVESMNTGFTPEVEAALKAAEDRGRELGKADGVKMAEERFAPVLAENAEIRMSQARIKASVILSGWKSEGKLPPAGEKFAEGILVHGTGDVVFSDGGKLSAADAFVQFMTVMTPVVDVSGKRVEDKDAVASEVEEAVFSELGVTVAEVAELAA